MTPAGFTPDQLAELNLLCLFNLDSAQAGLKVHAASATPAAIAAAARLHAQGLVSQADGGYLTAPGREAARHAQALRGLLNAAPLTT